MSSEIHVGDTTVLRVTVKESNTAVDVSLATTKEFILRRPDGTIVSVDPSFASTGSDGILQYQCVDELDAPGTWRVQLHLVLPSGEWHSDITQFTVKNNLQS